MLMNKLQIILKKGAGVADERNVDLLRLTVERDLERMKAEVASAKAELQAIKAELVQQVADAKVEIGERAIEKMYKAFSEFRTWAIVGVSLFFTIGGVTAYQIYTGARHIVESRIDDWLSFDKKGALLKESLESIRTRVVLDGLVTHSVIHISAAACASQKNRLHSIT